MKNSIVRILHYSISHEKMSKVMTSSLANASSGNGAGGCLTCQVGRIRYDSD